MTGRGTSENEVDTHSCLNGNHTNKQTHTKTHTHTQTDTNTHRNIDTNTCKRACLVGAKQVETRSPKQNKKKKKKKSPSSTHTCAHLFGKDDGTAGFCRRATAENLVGLDAGLLGARTSLASSPFLLQHSRRWKMHHSAVLIQPLACQLCLSPDPNQNITSKSKQTNQQQSKAGSEMTEEGDHKRE